jgi:hypothetical protein
MLNLAQEFVDIYYNPHIPGHGTASRTPLPHLCYYTYVENLERRV